MYEPMPNGKMELVAVEYITFKGPASLDGQLFNFTNSPNRYALGPFYELHVWSGKFNPRGAFADMNPDVTANTPIEHASAHMGIIRHRLATGREPSRRRPEQADFLPAVSNAGVLRC
jgi:hypothetical protein